MSAPMAFLGLAELIDVTLVGLVALYGLVAAFALAFVRLVLGPGLADRVIALDVMSIIGVCLASAYAIARDQPVFLDVAIVLALISFIATIAFARFIERGELRQRRRPR